LHRFTPILLFMQVIPGKTAVRLKSY
jgi:hypothetical protein